MTQNNDPAERELARRIAFEMCEFTRTEFFKRYAQELEREPRANEIQDQLTGLIEDGLLERAEVGRYRVIVDKGGAKDELAL